ncbi:MAG TPA: hypothetical protein VJT73_12190, partial [Polyangiaceae bacterium]|nr:hypothetical protein [Polyangiaceae bacterium]
MTKLLSWSLLVVLTSACGGGVRRFPLRAPMWKDTDTSPVSAPCRPDPKAQAGGKPHSICTPDAYESSFAWDGADNIVFRPLSRFFAVDPGGEATNVNSVDEVPDSSWFVNRIGVRAMSLAELEQGFCGDSAIDADAPDGSWVIDQGKMNGANPGFRIKDDKGVRYMLKADPKGLGEKATGATAIATRLYYAAGWWAPCDSVVYVRRSLLRLKPGLTVTDNTNTTRAFDEAALDLLLANAERRGDRVRMVASRWLPGRALGPFRYEGTRSDDPNDVILHEDRRDLRGARIMAAWLGHFDSREQNSMSTWMSENVSDPDASPGHIRHWYIDLGDCFGSEWEPDLLNRRINHAYYLDIPYLAEDFVTLGAIARPWDRARIDPDVRLFHYFSAKDFDPELWRGGYPNPTFGRMTERDGAWAARVIARFSRAHIEAAVRVGSYTDPRNSAYLVEQLVGRRQRILERYLSRLSPIADVAIEDGDRLCAVDLAASTGVAATERLHYTAHIYTGARFSRSAAPTVAADANGRVCASLAHFAPHGGALDDAPDRYAVVDLGNGYARGVLRAHLYDLGPQRGFRLVGV